MNWKLSRDIQSLLRVKGGWFVYLAMFAYGCGQGMLKPMNAIYLKNHIHLSKPEISILVSLSLIVDLIVTLFSGLLSDFVQKKRSLPIIASCVCMSGLLMYLRADNFSSALTAMIVATSPASVIMSQLFAMARNHFTLEAQDILELALVWLRASMSVGFFLGLLLGAEIFNFISFQGVLIGNFVSYGIVTFILFLYRERPYQALSVQKRGIPFHWISLIGLLLLLCGDAIRGLYFPLMLDTLFHSPSLVAHLWSLQAVFELVWMTLAGYAAERWGTLTTIRVGAICGFIVYIVYALHPSLGLLIFMQPIHSLYISVLYSIGMGYVQRMFLERTGFGSSLYLILTQTASLIGFLAPNLVPGFSPRIFLLPSGLVVAASLMLWWTARYQSIKSKHKGPDHEVDIE